MTDGRRDFLITPRSGALDEALGLLTARLPELDVTDLSLIFGRPVVAVVFRGAADELDRLEALLRSEPWDLVSADDTCRALPANPSSEEAPRVDP